MTVQSLISTLIAGLLPIQTSSGHHKKALLHMCAKLLHPNKSFNRGPMTLGAQQRGRSLQKNVKTLSGNRCLVQLLSKNIFYLVITIIFSMLILFSNECVNILRGRWSIFQCDSSTSQNFQFKLQSSLQLHPVIVSK